jgi:hypothetical protein
MSTRVGNVLKQGERFGGKVLELDQFSRGGKLPLCKRLRMGESTCKRVVSSGSKPLSPRLIVQHPPWLGQGLSTVFAQILLRR